MNMRKIKLTDYGISENRYQELLGFCRQYPEWLEELKYKTHTVKSLQLTDVPADNRRSDPTQNLAVRRAELAEKCRIVEQAAFAASSDLCDYIIQGVAYQKPIWYLIDIMGMPAGANLYYDIRKMFFVKLDDIKDAK